MTRTFHCDKCGACCSQLKLFGSLYAFLDDGSGVCRYYDKETKLCTIYEHRPLQCRVEEGYHAYFADIPYEDYLKGVEEGCRKLRQSLSVEQQEPSDGRRQKERVLKAWEL